MKTTHMLLTAAVAVLAASQASADCLIYQSGGTSGPCWVSGGAGKRTVDVLNAPGITFQEKLENSVEMAAINPAVNSGSGLYGNAELYIRKEPTGGYHSLSSTVVVDLKQASQNVRNPFDIRCDDQMRIRYFGTSGPAIEFFNAYAMDITNLNIDLHNSQTIGIAFSGGARWVKMRRCRVYMLPDVHSSVGILFNGQALAGTTGADVSSVHLDACEVTSMKHEDYVDTNFTWEKLRDVGNTKNVGFGLFGGDSMANTIERCSATRMRVGFTNDLSDLVGLGLSVQGPSLYAGNLSNGGNGLLTFRESMANYSYVGWHLVGFGHYNIFGGRSENCGNYIHYGVAGANPNWGENGSLGIFGAEFSQLATIISVTNNWASNAVLTINAGGSVLVDNCRVNAKSNVSSSNLTTVAFRAIPNFVRRLFISNGTRYTGAMPTTTTANGWKLKGVDFDADLP
jgi:hypothetical protein